ncbi:MAG: MBL fold metallo-hydrolase [Candidatus Thermoplasmatota archaeon]|nr:MBL fold metallo-hydrolase [Candidatus Thermoplasmatota archaeon]
MDIQFLGGAAEVGRLGMLLRDQGTTLLCDYGLAPSDPPQYPMEAPPVDALLLSHSHLDHCGMVPVVSRQSETKTYTTPVTQEVANLLLKDSLKISAAEGYPEPFDREDVQTMNQGVVAVDYGDTFQVGNLEVDVHSAGHIPGSSMFRINDRETVLFTGDLQTIDTHLVRGTQPVPCDVLVLESTYAGRHHPDRAQTEAQFLARIDEVVERGGTALVPCFAVARTQEVLMVLAETDHEIWVDGMGRQVARMYQRHRRFIRSPKRYERALGRARIVHSQAARDRALRGDVILTTGGMLSGGPVLHYLAALKDDLQSEVLLTGYQVEGTNGRLLLDTRNIELQGVRVPVEAEISSHDFSAHAGHAKLVEFVEGCDPTRVVLMHGDAREELAEALEGRDVILPEDGERHTL